MKIDPKIILLAVASFASGYVVCEKKLRQHYSDMANDEIAEAKKYYQNRLHEEIRSYTETESQLQDAAAAVALEKYVGGNQEETLPTHEAVAKVTEGGSEVHDADADVYNKDKSPCFISYEMFEASKLGFEDETLTYYIKDDVLAGQDNRVVPPEERMLILGGLVGPDLKMTDGSAAYIRSYGFEMDFEIVAEDSSYNSEVLGNTE